MQVTGQKWLFRIRNSEVVIENAFARIGYSQERITVNNEIVYARKGWGFFIFGSIVLAEIELMDEILQVVVGFTVEGTTVKPHCRLVGPDDIHRPVETFEGKWDTREYVWPPGPGYAIEPA